MTSEPTPTPSETPVSSPTPAPAETPAPSPTPMPSETTEPTEPPVVIIDLVQMVPEQWQIVAVALALLVFSLGIFIAVRI